MPKEEKLWRKLKKIEKQIKKRARRRRRIRSSSSSSTSSNESELRKNLPSGDEATSNILPEDNSGTRVIEEGMELDDTTLLALGNPSNIEKSYGEDIHPEILIRIKSILTDGIDKDLRDNLSKKYLIPQNLTLLEAPKLNLELEGLLNDPIKERDKRVEVRQQQLGIALSAVLSVVDSLVKSKNDNKLIETLTDVSRLLSDLHYNDTCTRRKLISNNLDKNILKTAESLKRDSFLFGEKFNENVKAANAIKRAAPTILKKSNFVRKSVQQKPSIHYYNNKENFNAPPYSGRAKQGRGGRYQTRNTGRQHQPRTPSGKTYRHKPVRQT